MLQDVLKPVAKTDCCLQLKNAAINFNRLSNEIGKNTDDRFKRIQVCAQINARLCEAWRNNSVFEVGKIDSIDFLTPTLILERLKKIGKTNLHKALHERTSILLDPLGP